MTARSTHFKRWVPLLTSVLLVSSCGSGTTPATTGSDASATTVAEATTSSAEPTTTTEAPEKATTTAVRTQASADCLIGGWELDSTAFLESVFTEAAGDLGDVTVTHGGGSYVITLFDDGTFEGVREDWQMRFESSDGVFVTTLDGSEEGSWSTDGDTIGITTEASDISVTQAFEIDGELQELPFGGTTQTVRTDVFAGEGTFTCDEEEMTVTFEGITSVLNRT